MTKKTKTPDLAVPILYCTPAGRKIVNVVPQSMGGTTTVSFEGETAKFTRDHQIPGDGKFKAIYVQGQGFLDVWGDAELTPEEFDTTANNNILEQIHSLSHGGKTAAMGWATIAMVGAILLGLVFVTVKLGGDIDDLRTDIKFDHANSAPQYREEPTPAQPAPQENRVANPNPVPPGGG